MNPVSEERVERIRGHVGADSPLSRIVAHAVVIAIRRLILSPEWRPWELDDPTPRPSARRTIYVAASTSDAIDHLRGLLQQQEAKPGWAPTTSVVVARALALAEQEMNTFSPDDLELMRIEAEADAIERELEQLPEAATDKDIESIRSRMTRSAALTVRAGTVFHRCGREMGTAYAASASLMDGRLLQLSRRIGDMIIAGRRVVDQRSGH